MVGIVEHGQDTVPDHYGGLLAPTEAAASADSLSRGPPTFPIVGIGASAGGLNALEQFLEKMPAESGMAIVVVQHLDPTRQGLLVEILQRSTAAPVSQITDNLRVRPNHVYVIPPDRDLSIQRGRFRLLAPSAARGQRLPIDFFLRSLAAEQQSQAIAVILSGMGSDGTLGAHAIKDQGGEVFAQSPASAQFDSMPRSAIDAGIVDVIANASDLPSAIIAHTQHEQATVPTAAPAVGTVEQSQPQSAYQQILALLQFHSGQDFSLYKQSTIYRRIERRMNLHHVNSLDDYAEYLRVNPLEVELLFKELLIGVTSFFRDPEVWNRLRDECLPPLLEARAGRPLRAWTPACSTGEEAYTLAMIFQEALAQVPRHHEASLKIFATDLDKDAITKARTGFYSHQIAEHVTPERLDRFFVREDRGYRLRKEIREMVIFASHNIYADPPFTNLHILTCRNLLIYLTSKLQKTLLPLFHYSLSPGGYLLLGNAESVGSSSQLFELLPGKARLYRRRDVSFDRVSLELPYMQPSASHGVAERQHLPSLAMKPPLNLQTLADRLLLQLHTPAAVLTNREGDILYINGRTGKYLEPAAGKANWNIFAMARDGLRFTLEQAFKSAVERQATVLLDNVRLHTDGGEQLVRVQIQPLTEPEAMRDMVLLVFEEIKSPLPRAPADVDPADAPTSSLVEHLEQELLQARQSLHSAREEMHATQQELSSINEELQSTNEELQSTNEELVTSREEMQSMNEELQTVNQELQSKVDDLSRTSNDMHNLLNSTEIATLFLDDQLRVRRYTTQLTRIIKLIPGDVGRPITDLTSALDYPSLGADVQEVLKSLAVIEKSVATNDARWFTVRIMPYRTEDNRIEGVVVTFTEITAAKRLELALRETSDGMQTLLESVNEAFVAVDSNLIITQLNLAAERLLKQPRTAVLHKRLLDSIPESGRSQLEQACRQALQDRAPRSVELMFPGNSHQERCEVHLYAHTDGVSLLFQTGKRPREIASSEHMT